ncbi:MAG: argininosuccinate lyase [Clostridiales bacterium]|jgi:argininosuccinate lyase|nr:argininosuccinate lyase [Clostridiales bacterium]
MDLQKGRFDKPVTKAAFDFNASLSVDGRMYREDVAGSIAHAKMLGKQGILSQADVNLIVPALVQIEADITAGRLPLVGAEDIHMLVEAELTKRIGEAGKRLHTARSRNDQVATDLRLYVRGACDGLQQSLTALCDVLLSAAETHLYSYMAAYTHLQKAQPVSLAHYLHAYAEMFLRDRERLSDAARRANLCPLGSCALAGTTFPIDRAATAADLGFTAPARNSIDGVSDRDFALETASACALSMVHLSRLAEELIIWSSTEFGYVTISDGYSTTSSIMPQKKNPDVAELIRGKTARVLGDQTALYTLLKGLPFAYNKDMQEDKEALFDALDTTAACLDLMTGMMSEVTYHVGRLRDGAARGYAQATDVADYLTKKGLPFREAHAVVGKMVRDLSAAGKTFEELALTAFQAYSPLFAADITDAIKIENTVRARNHIGGPAPETVKKALAAARKALHG